jgi:hypothetical protein
MAFDAGFEVNLGARLCAAIFIAFHGFVGFRQQIVKARSAHQTITQMLHSSKFRQVRDVDYMACSLIASVA